MRHRRVVLAVALGALVASGAGAQNPAKPGSLIIGKTDFQVLRWVEGDWRGEGDSTATFFERYHFTTDSSLLVERFPTDKFTGPTSQRWYDYRNRRLETRGSGPTQWVAVALDSLSATFRPASGADNSLAWRKQGPNEWLIVVTSPPTVDKPARTVTYHMKRVR